MHLQAARRGATLAAPTSPLALGIDYSTLLKLESKVTNFTHKRMSDV
jgi:hypothetical protein